MRLARAAVALALAALALPAVARADGDPASDILLQSTAFVPYDAHVSRDDATRLATFLADAKRRGYEIRVALVPTKPDLGAVTPLWRQPQQYARFLGQELFFVYKGRLLTVMPNGYGFNRPGRSPAAEVKLLRRQPPPGNDYAGAAMAAVRKLAAAEGIDVPIPAAPGSKSHTTRDRLELGGIALAAALLGGLVLAARRLRARRGEFG